MSFMRCPDTIEHLKTNPKYKGFTFLPKPELFRDFFADKDYPLVQLYDMTCISENDIVGFAGVFSWMNRKFTPLDGDSYSPDLKIWGYKEFDNADKHCLSILSDEW